VWRTNGASAAGLPALATSPADNASFWGYPDATGTRCAAPLLALRNEDSELHTPADPGIASGVDAMATPDDCENSSNSNDAAKTRRIKDDTPSKIVTKYAANALRSSNANADCLRRAADYDDEVSAPFTKENIFLVNRALRQT
jgi:hypothetical protein